MELLLILTVCALLAAGLLLLRSFRPELPPEEPEPIVMTEGPLVHGGGLGDLRSSRQPTPKDSYGNQ